MFQEEQLGFSKYHRVVDTRLVTFTHQTAMQLNDPDLKRYPSFRFPAVMPITVEQRHVQKIKHGNYLFSAKADGVRVLLLFFKYYIEGDWKLMCVSLTRDGSCHLLSVEAQVELYENGGSLFDGELVATSSGWYTILLFDCYSYKGTSMRELPLARRMGKCEDMAQGCKQRETDSVRIQTKPYYRLCKSHLPEAIAFLNNANHYLDYMTDGIILVQAGKADVVHGRNETQFKLKLDHTIDLVVIQDVEDADKPFYLASYDDTDDSYIAKQQVDIVALGASVGMIYECRVVTVDGIHTFQPLKPRLDKTHANSEGVVQRTLQTITDNIGVTQLMLT